VIDESKLPLRAAFDTSVLVASRKDAEANYAVCKAIWESMLKGGRYILIPAPALAEFVRNPDSKPPPRVDRVEIVAFDELAAIRMGTFPPVAVTATPDYPKAVLKFDAMIVACAIRHRADALISLDEKQRKLAVALGLRAVEPNELKAAQGALF
jgi:predicted nucleic acid-binding protein